MKATAKAPETIGHRWTYAGVAATARRELEQTLAALKVAIPGFIDAADKGLHETLAPYLAALGECLSKARQASLRT